MLYHKNLGFPDDVKLFSGIFKLNYSKHAIAASKNDRYGIINIPDFLDTSTAVLVEIEVINNIMVKGVYRLAYNNNYDIVIVMTNNCVVKTVWLNDNQDKHSTLDESKYIKLNNRG